jgi:hypothetical protein
MCEPIATRRGPQALRAAQMVTSLTAACAFWRVAALEFQGIRVIRCYRPFSCLRKLWPERSMASRIGMSR